MIFKTAMATPNEKLIAAVKAQPTARRYSIIWEYKSSPILFLSFYLQLICLLNFIWVKLSIIGSNDKTLRFLYLEARYKV